MVKHVKRIVLAALAFAVPAAAAPATRRPRARARAARAPGAHGGRLALAVDAPRPPQHRQQPASAGATAAATGPGASAPAKGVFSTPVVGADETVYVGSGDRWFYALGPGGHLRWRYRTGEIIDSAAVLGRREPRLGSSTVTFGSGDEHIYRLRTTKAPLSRSARTVWRFAATRPPAAGQLVNWWEGNVTMGFGGTLFAGNTGGAEYSIDRQRPPALDLPDHELRVVERRDRRRRQRLLRLARPVLPRAHPAGQDQVDDLRRQLRDLVPGHRRRRDGVHRVVRRRALRAGRPDRAACAGASRPTTTCTPRPRWAAASCTSPPPTARSTRWTGTGTSAGATTPAT